MQRGVIGVLVLVAFAVGVKSSVMVESPGLLFQRKFTGGHFQGGAAKLLATSVRSKLECAFLCVAARPRCQSFNLRRSNALQVNGSFSYDCQVLDKIPQSLTENTGEYFDSEEGAAYYELVYDPEMKTLPCATANICPSHAEVCNALTVVQRNNNGLFRFSYCLEVHQKSLTWDAARDACIANGGQLLVDNRNEIKRETMNPMKIDASAYWIGGHGNYTGQGDKSRNKLWLWQGNTPIDEFFWAVTEPNEPNQRNCIVIKHITNSATMPWQWADRKCTDLTPFVCEYHDLERL